MAVMYSVEGGELGVHGVAGGGDLSLALDGHGAGAEAEGQGVGGFGFEDLREIEFVGGHGGSDGGLDEGGGEARKDGGDAARFATGSAIGGKDVLVEDGGLGEVGDLGGASDVGGGGEDGVLKEGAKEGVGAEALGCGGEDFEEVGSGVEVGAGLPCTGWMLGRSPGCGGGAGGRGCRTR